ncbi:transposase [Streptomyces sp. Ag82_O1-15]|uniref:transposase n=1 Tax=Streptomyces sp. OV198 TaxID=1882787 RepID=UPI0026A9C3EE
MVPIEIRDAEARLTRLVERHAPQLLDVVGIGPDTAVALLITVGDNPERLDSEASFAALCGVSPVERSSGRRQFRRLNRGGDRQANAALHRIVFTRLRVDSRTQDYYERRIKEGKTRREIVRCLIGEVLMVRPNPWVVTPSVGVGGRPRCRAALDGQFELPPLTRRGPRPASRTCPTEGRTMRNRQLGLVTCGVNRQLRQKGWD